MGFLADTETTVTSSLKAVADAFGAGLLGTFKPAFIVGFTIWITLIAYEVAFGKSEDGFTYIFTKIGRVFLIGVIALFAWPSLEILLLAIKDGFVGSGTMSAILENNLITPITELWARLFQWFGDALSSVGWTQLGRLFSTIALFMLLFASYAVLSLAVAVFGVIALAMYLVANSIFLLLMAMGPFFLLCLAFPFTQKFFESYIGNVMTSIFAMALTVLMVMFVGGDPSGTPAGLFGLRNIESVIPTLTDEATVTEEIKSLAVLFASKAALSLLIIYLYYKVFDLASALGGGLNMGANMIGGVRSMLRSGSAGGRPATTPNTMHGGGGGGGGGGTPPPPRPPSARAALANRAMAMVGTGAGQAAIGAGYAALGAGKAVNAVGRYAYNRFSSLTNRISAG